MMRAALQRRKSAPALACNQPKLATKRIPEKAEISKHLNHYETVNLQNQRMCNLKSRVKRGNGAYHNTAMGKKKSNHIMNFQLPSYFD